MQIDPISFEEFDNEGYKRALEEMIMVESKKRVCIYCLDKHTFICNGKTWCDCICDFFGRWEGKSAEWRIGAWRD